MFCFGYVTGTGNVEWGGFPPIVRFLGRVRLGSGVGDLGSYDFRFDGGKRCGRVILGGEIFGVKDTALCGQGFFYSLILVFLSSCELLLFCFQPCFFLPFGTISLRFFQKKILMSSDLELHSPSHDFLIRGC